VRAGLTTPSWLALLALALFGCGGSGTGEQSAASADRGATDAAYAFLDTYTTAEGRVERTDQGGDTVGEGQAYGLLAAAAVGDPERFDRIWSWTRENITRPDGLLAFRWADGGVQDPQAATDADLDVAHALIVAGCRFKRPDLSDAARRIGQALLRREVARVGGTAVLVAGPWATTPPRVTINPSYLDPVTLAALERLTGDRRFAALAATGRRHIATSSDPLPPDWASVGPTAARAMPISGPDSSTGPGRYSFDAARTLIRLAVDPDPAGRRLAARAWEAFEGREPADIVVEHALDGRPIGRSRHPIALVAAAGAAKAAGQEEASAGLLEEAEALHREQPTYYGGAWVALGRLMLQTRRLTTCT